MFQRELMAPRHTPSPPDLHRGTHSRLGVGHWSAVGQNVLRRLFLEGSCFHSDDEAVLLIMIVSSYLPHCLISKSLANRILILLLVSTIQTTCPAHLIFTNFPIMY